MEFLFIVWDDSEGGNAEHIAEHGLTPDEVEQVLCDPRSRFGRSRSSGLPIAFGYTLTGRHILVAFDEIEERTIYPVTAYDVPER